MNASKLFILFLIAGIILSHQSCKAPVQRAISLPENGQFFNDLDEYGIHETSNGKFVPTNQLTKYEVVNALFSDYSVKDRYLYLPEGKKAILKSDGHFDWPVGTILVKNFSYDNKQVENGRLLETRLLVKDELGWKAVSYQWDAKMNSSRLNKLGDIIPMMINHKNQELEFDYIIPNKNQCKSCHNANDKIEPIGFRFQNIDKSISIDGTQISQINHLISKGIIEISDPTIIPEKMVSYNDTTASVQNRALAYLDINCGHCHRPNGPGNTSGLFLQYNETRSNHLGICKPPVAAGKGAGGRSYDIQPGNADASILYYRMLSQEPGEMMPELGRSLIHQEGLELVKKWINDLEGNCN